MELMCLVHVLGNRPGARIGIVKFYESGYYQQTIDRAEWTEKDVKDFVSDYNLNVFGVSDEVASAAQAGSMFGWHVPAAKPAVEFFTRKHFAQDQQGS